MKKKLISFFKHLFFFLPAILGIPGFLLSGESLMDAAFLSLSLYFVNYQNTPPNLLIECARWIAPIVTASSIMLVVASAQTKLHNFIAQRTGKGTAVYGSKLDKYPILKELGIQGIDNDDQFQEADQYILLNDERDNLAFYWQNKDSLDKHTVYLKSASIPAQSNSSTHLQFFCPEEIAARLFWKRYCPYELSVAHNHKLNVVIMGFGKLGQEILRTAILQNIFSPQQHIAYHILGEENGFKKIHHELCKITDPITFYSSPWYENISLIQQADFIVVTEQNDQLALLRDMLLALPRTQVHVLMADSYGPQVLVNQNTSADANAPAQLILFDWSLEAKKLEHIRNDELYTRAKKLHEYYRKKYKSDITWDKLDAFTRYSNIFAADYHDVLRKIAPSVDNLSENERNVLAELEHIRWCRYHYWNNWTYAAGPKDPVLRTHSLLQPFAAIPNDEKEKDLNNVRLAYEMD